MQANAFLRKFSLGLYIYTLFIILWGAWVRISKSGDGCGDSWPLCDGALFPEVTRYATYIEYFHRLTTGLFGLIILFLVYYVSKNHKKWLLVKKVVYWTLFFTITESLLGAALVKFGLVVDNDSLKRLIFMSVHQVNSVLLSGSIGLLYLIAKAGSETKLQINKFNLFILFTFLALLCSGPLAALSTSLFPSEALWEGVVDDIAHNTHWIVRYRILHPVLATLLSAVMLYVCFLKYKKTNSQALKVFIKLLFVGALFGASTLIMLYPLWMKLVHLALAHILFLAVLNLFIENNRPEHCPKQPNH
jgi:cytochrome c oxidase assembly protein subunit 15